MPLTLDEMLTRNGFVKLARAFPTLDDATRVLDDIGFPVAHRPQGFNDPEQFWWHVGNRISAGVTAGGFEALLAAAARFRPHNTLFREFADAAPAAPRQPAPAALTLEGLMRQNGFAELGRVFSTADQAEQVLDRIGFPIGARPMFGSHGYYNPDAFWREVCQRVESGTTEGGLEALLAAAAHFRPYNRLFRQYVEQHAPPPLTEADASRPSLFVTSRRPAAEVVDTVRRLAVERGLLGQVTLEASTDTGLTVLGFDQASADQVRGLAPLLGPALGNAAGPARVTFSANDDRSTTLRQLYVEGADQSRFELTQVPVSTTPGEIARAVMAEYAAAPDVGPVRPMVVDYVRADGTNVRLDPDRPIGEQGVADGDRLEVHPESFAAGPDPAPFEVRPARKSSKRNRQSILILRTAAPQTVILDLLRTYQAEGGAELEFASYHTYVLRLTSCPPVYAVEVADKLRERLGLATEDVTVTRAAHADRVLDAVLADSLRPPRVKPRYRRRANAPPAALRPLPGPPRAELLRPDGTTTRLDPAQTLHDLGLTDGDKLRLSIGPPPI